MTEFDLAAYVAETTPDPFKIRFGRLRLEVAGAPDVRAIAAYDAGDFDGCLRLILGAEQYTALVAEGGLVTREAVLELIKRQAEHQRTSLGESGASGSSSRSTQRRSKRTSSATTRSR